MLKCKHRTLILLGGIIWLAIGIMLLTFGINFLLSALHNPSLTLLEGRFSVLRFFTHFFSDPSHSAIMVLTVALLIGFFKGKIVLAKSVARQVQRITLLPNPASLKYLYSKGYYFLIGGMMLMGLLLRFLPITLDTRGAIDAAIGSALINGAMLFFRESGKCGSINKRFNA